MIYLGFIYAGDLALGRLISNTSWWGEDATQMYSTEEVCRGVVNWRTVCERYIAKTVIDGTINYTPISFDATHSVCALPKLARIRIYLIFYTH